MWNKPVLTLAVLASVVAFGSLTESASAQLLPRRTLQANTPPPAPYTGYDPSSVTPFGISPTYVAPSYVAPSYVAPSYVAPAYVPPTYAFNPLVTPSIPLNNQDMSIYSGSFSNFGIPNGYSLYNYSAYAPTYNMPYAPSTYNLGGYNATYVPPAYTYGGYNPSSVTPFK